MGGQTSGETMGYDDAGPHRRWHRPRPDARGAGRRLQSAGGDRRDAPQEEAASKRARARCCWMCVTYRLSGHSTSDASTYRTQEEIEAWTSSTIRWPSYQQKLIEAGVATDARARRRSEQTSSDPHHRDVQARCRPESISPCMDLARRTRTAIENIMFSNQKVDKMPRTVPAMCSCPRRTIPRVQQIAKKAGALCHRKRQAALQERRCYSIRDGIFEAIIDKYSTRIPPWSPTARTSATGAAPSPFTRGLTEALPYHSASSTPRSPRRPSSAPPWATPWPAAARSSS